MLLLNPFLTQICGLLLLAGWSQRWSLGYQLLLACHDFHATDQVISFSSDARSQLTSAQDASTCRSASLTWWYVNSLSHWIVWLTLFFGPNLTCDPWCAYCHAQVWEEVCMFISISLACSLWLLAILDILLWPFCLIFKCMNMDIRIISRLCCQHVSSNVLTNYNKHNVAL